MDLSLVGTILYRLVDLYTLLIVVWALFSWFPHDKGLPHDIYKVLDSLVGPFIGLFKRFIPTLGGLDISPIIAILLLEFVLKRLILLLFF